MQSPHLKFSFADASKGAAFARQLKEQLGIEESQLQENWSWVVAEGPRTEAYLTPPEVASSLEKLLKNRMPYSLGLFAGGVERERLQVSLELASYFAGILPDRKLVTLKNEAEQPVLYGRDVLAGSIQHIEKTVRKRELIALTSQQEEILALGEMLADAQDLQRAAPNQRVIRNLIDKGWYLRKGG